MNEARQLFEALSPNKKAIIEVILENPDCLISLPWLKLSLCKPRVVSERRLRSNLDALVSDGILGEVRSASGIMFYGFANVANDPDKQRFTTSLRAKKASRGEHLGSIVATRRTVHITPEETIKWLRKAKESPVYCPPGRSAKTRRAQMKNYMTAIDWQIEACKQMIERRKLEQRRKEIEEKYRKPKEASP